MACFDKNETFKSAVGRFLELKNSSKLNELDSKTPMTVEQAQSKYIFMHKDKKIKNFDKKFSSIGPYQVCNEIFVMFKVQML